MLDYQTEFLTSNLTNRNFYLTISQGLPNPQRPKSPPEDILDDNYH